MKRNILLVIVLINFSILSLTQEKKDTILYSRISLAYNPAFTYRTLKSDNSQSAILLKNKLDSIESTDLGYSAGLNFSHMFGKHIGLNFGVNYSVFNDRTRNGSIDEYTNYQNTYSYLSIPLQLVFNSNFTKKINYYLITGVSQNFLIAQKQRVFNELKNEDISFNTKYDLKKSVLMWNGGVGVNFRLNRNFYFATELFFNQSISEINATGILEKSIFSIGPNFKFGYSFCEKSIGFLFKKKTNNSKKSNARIEENQQKNSSNLKSQRDNKFKDTSVLILYKDTIKIDYKAENKYRIIDTLGDSKVKTKINQEKVNDISNSVVNKVEIQKQVVKNTDLNKSDKSNIITIDNKKSNLNLIIVQGPDGILGNQFEMYDDWNYWLGNNNRWYAKRKVNKEWNDIQKCLNNDNYQKANYILNKKSFKVK
jgi:hypothetical protein